jgi:hypothetical protein
MDYSPKSSEMRAKSARGIIQADQSSSFRTLSALLPVVAPELKSNQKVILSRGRGLTRLFNF